MNKGEVQHHLGFFIGVESPPPLGFPFSPVIEVLDIVDSIYIIAIWHVLNVIRYSSRGRDMENTMCQGSMWP